MDVTWPPSGAQAVLLGQLAELIERGGVAHLLDAPVVRMDTRDFPEPWQPTLAAVERLLARLFWHAHVDLDVTVDDLRGEAEPGKLLSRSEISWIQTKDGVAEFQCDAIGNDNVAGALCHEVGRAYLAWMAAATPYRDDRGPPSERAGSIAAIYLGLGVLAANAAEYRRTAGEIRGRTAVTEWDVVMTGGLSTPEALYLLAAQRVLIGAPVDAHTTLRGELREQLAAMVDALAPHRAALAEHLAIDLAAPRPPLARDPAPAAVSDDQRPEPDRKQRFAGARTYRTPEHRMESRMFFGLVLGIGAAVLLGAIAGAGALPLWVYFGVVGAITAAGGVIGLRTFRDRCYWGKCLAILPRTATACPGCGATIAGRLEDHRDELARQAEEEDERLDQLRLETEREAAGGASERDRA